jgi:hypothetical protein
MEINANISDISMDFKKTPFFQNKPLIDFYENESEDLSMLNEIGGVLRTNREKSL